MIELGLKAFKAVEKSSARGQKEIHGAIDDDFCPEQEEPPKAAKPLYGKVHGETDGAGHKKRGRLAPPSCIAPEAPAVRLIA